MHQQICSIMKRHTGARPDKVYCSKCDLVFRSRTEFDRHLLDHSVGSRCEVCPLDMAVAKVIGLFRRNRNRFE